MPDPTKQDPALESALTFIESSLPYWKHGEAVSECYHCNVNYIVAKMRERLKAEVGHAASSASFDSETELRKELWRNHGCHYPALYGDDGEMQCSNGGELHRPLDFKRQPIVELVNAVNDIRLRRVAAAMREREGL